jgi:PAS domain S-box-containing protein
MRTTDPSSDEYQQARERIMVFADVVKDKSDDFDEVLMLDLDGIVIASTCEEALGDDRSSREYYQIGLRETHVTSVYESPTLYRPTMLVSTPLILDNKTIGVAVGRINLSRIHTTVNDQKGLGKTDRAALIDKNGDTINGSGDLHIYNVDKDFSGIYDRNGRTVVGAQVSISDQGWFLIVEQDHDEILSALHTLLERAIVVTFGVIVMIGLFSIFVTKQIIKPIRHLYEGTGAVATGDYSVQVPVITDDEIGTLTERFNKMTSELGETYRKLEDKIALVNRDLEDQKSKLESVLHSMVDCVFATDIDFKITMFNRACEEFTGISSSDAVGRFCYDVFPTDACKEQCRLRESIDGHATGICWEMHVTDRGGRSIPIMTCGAPLRDSDGNITGYVEVLRDVTELAKVTDELRSANTELEVVNAELRKVDQLKTDFLDIASHELRTPLTSIRGFSGVLADGMLGELNEKQKDALLKVISNSDRMIRLINDMLDISRIRSGRLEMNIARLDISEVIEGVVAGMKLLSEKKSISQIVDIPDSLVIEGDRDRIEQLITNLVDNAIKFTPDGGSVSVNASDHETCVEVTISDTGIGIALDDLPHVFEEFWQVKKSKGIGLGLTIAANIVREHGGEVWATSEKGAGSTFGFRLPKKIAHDSGEVETSP